MFGRLYQQLWKSLEIAKIAIIAKIAGIGNRSAPATFVAPILRQYRSARD
jgi:hypothetical protein